MKSRWGASLAPFLLLLGGSVAAAKPLRVAPGSEVSFAAKITGSSFVGKSEAVSGTVDYDDATSNVRSATIVVLANSFKTGMDMRDEHTRDKYLEASKFPEIRFEVRGAKLAAAPGTRGTLDGTMIVKGSKRSVRAHVTVSGTAAAPVVTATFPLNVTEFGIPQPRFAVVKMEPTIQVTAKIVLAPAG